MILSNVSRDSDSDSEISVQSSDGESKVIDDGSYTLRSTADEHILDFKSPHVVNGRRQDVHFEHEDAGEQVIASTNDCDPGSSKSGGKRARTRQRRRRSLEERQNRSEVQEEVMGNKFG